MFVAHVTETFEAAHHNAPPDQPDHKCARNHGHSWRAEIWISYSELTVQHSPTGWGPDFGAMKAVIRSLDHQDLNELFDVPPSAENVAKWLYNQIREETGINPLRVRIHEANQNWVEYSRGD